MNRFSKDNLNHMNRFFCIVSAKTKFSIDPMTSDIRLLRALDRESLTTQGARGSSSNNTGIQPLKVTCTVEAGGKVYTARRRTLNIVVSDINDNPPVFQKERGMQYLETSVEITEGSQTDTVRKKNTFCSIVLTASGKHVYEIYTYHTPLLYSKKWGMQGYT